MGFGVFAKVKTVKTKNCFVSISKNLPVKKTSLPVVFEIGHLHDAKPIYVSWAGNVLDEDDAVGFNTLFVTHLGLCEGQEVTMKECLGEINHCRRVDIEPLDPDDISNLDLVQDRVANSLLDQIRVIWKGASFPIWIGNCSFSVRVDDVKPSGGPVLLVDGTEVHVIFNPFMNPDVVDSGQRQNENKSDPQSPGAALSESVLVSTFRNIFSFARTEIIKPETDATSPQEKKMFIAGQKVVLGLRIAPICDENFESSPTTVYICETALQRRGFGFQSHFLASVSKILSPKEREEVKKCKDSKKESDPTQENACIVIVVILDESRKGPIFPDLSEDDVVVPSVLRRQMGLELGSCLKISSIDYAGSVASVITLFPLSQLPKSPSTEEYVGDAFEKWVSIISRERPYVAKTGNLVRLLLEDKLEVDFVLKLDIGSKSTSPSTPELPQTLPYCLLTPENAGAMKLHLGKKTTPSAKKPWGDILPFESISLLNRDSKSLRLDQLGGVSEVAQRVLGNLQLWLRLDPLAREFSGIPPSHCSLLICGQKGIGKSTLIAAIRRELTQRAVYTSVVKCALFVGSKTKTIQNYLRLQCAECVHRQPSLLLLDDLDEIAAAPTGPADEASLMAVYCSRNAQVVRRTLEISLEKDFRLAFLATSVSTKSVHSSLMTNRGSQIFQDVVELQPPDRDRRREMLESLLRSKLCGEENPNVTQVANSTEGYLASDLEMLVEKAKHSAWMRTAGRASDGESTPTLEDFELARESFRPSSLRALNLHEAGWKTWSDVGGLENVKRSLLETLVWPTEYPDLFASCPIRMQSGILLYGPPGTGKTLLAGVVAAECKLNFVGIKGPELLSKYVGASEESVRDLFERAQSAKPCVLFFDEFDAIAPRRGHDNTGVTDRVVNQFLTQMDGVESLKGVYVLAATSRPDIIDPALLRPGRLDKFLYCPLPEQEEREDILRCLSRHLTLDPDVDLASLASKTEHFSGADLQALLYSAQLESIHNRSGRSKSVTPSSPSEDEFIYVTCDGASPRDLGRDERQKILQQIATAKENVLSKTVQSVRPNQTSQPSICISSEDLEVSLSKTKPSVGPIERRRYRRLFESFSKGVMPTPNRLQRTTLA